MPRGMVCCLLVRATKLRHSLTVTATHTIIYGMFIGSIYDMPKITVSINNINTLSIYGIYGIYGMYSNTILHPPSTPLCVVEGGGMTV